MKARKLYAWFCAAGGVFTVGAVVLVAFGQPVPGIAALCLTLAAIALSYRFFVVSMRVMEQAAEERKTAETRAAAGFAQAFEKVLGLGKTIQHTVESTASTTRRIEGLISGTADGIVVLKQVLTGAVTANDKSAEAQNRVKNVLDEYSKEVIAETTEVQTMLRAFENMSESASSKHETAGRILVYVQNAEGKYATIKTAADKMASWAQKMTEMNALIQDVAVRTNLLAMNASIEAAHSGAAGRGFAVVAGQVRVLSEETSKSSQAIADTLRETVLAIDDTVSAASGANEYFRSLSEEIHGVVSMFDEVLKTIMSLSDGSKLLMTSIGRVSNLTEETSKVLQESLGSMDAARASLHTITEIVGTIYSDASSMLSAFSEMIGHANELRSLGTTNLSAVMSIGTSSNGTGDA